MVILDSPWRGEDLQGTSPVLWCITGVGGRGRSQTWCLPPAHHWGHSQTGVCLLFPSSQGGIHCGVAWPIWATCTLPRLWCWGSGVLAGVDRHGAQGREGQAQLAFPWEVCFGRGPVAPGGSQTRRRDGSPEAQLWVFAWCKQVPWQEPVPFGILAGGWARETALRSEEHTSELQSR